METKATGHSVSTPSSYCPAHCPCIAPWSGCEKEQCCLDSQLFLANLPRPKSWHGFFSPFSFSVFSASTSSFFYLHAALLMFCFCFQKRLISKREKEKQLQTSRYRRQHVTSKPLLVYLYVSACQMIILCCAVHYAKIRLPDNKLWGFFFFVLHCNITEHCAGLSKC